MSDQWQVLLVYGSFVVPGTDRNFIVVRIPSGRGPWAKKIRPAINRLVRQWFHPEDLKYDRFCGKGKRERRCFWEVDWDHIVWETKAKRYEWDGQELKQVS